MLEKLANASIYTYIASCIIAFFIVKISLGIKKFFTKVSYFKNLIISFYLNKLPIVDNPTSAWVQEIVYFNNRLRSISSTISLNKLSDAQLHLYIKKEIFKLVQEYNTTTTLFKFLPMVRKVSSLNNKYDDIFTKNNNLVSCVKVPFNKASHETLLMVQLPIYKNEKYIDTYFLGMVVYLFR